MIKSCKFSLLILVLIPVPALAVEQQAIDDLLVQIPARQEQSLLLQLNSTFPGVNATSSSAIVMWNAIDFALAAYWIGDAGDWGAADAQLISLLNDVRTFTDSGGQPYTKTPYQDDVDNEHFHWNAYLLARIHLLFSSQSDFFPGRMSAAAEAAVLQMLFDWAQDECRIEYADPSSIHISWGSENHHAQEWVSFWTANQVLKDDPTYQNQTYTDGSTPIQNAVAFDEYFKAYCRERALNGCTVEHASPTYAKYTLNTWLNLYDFAEDLELKEQANMLLDIYWADWALEQVDGQRGGSRHRNYPGAPGQIETGAAGHSAILFGTGLGTAQHPGDMSALTTSWRPSHATVALYLGSDDLGVFEYNSRRLGLKDPAPPLAPPQLGSFAWNFLNPEGGSLLRTTWRTPEFIMGMSQVDLLPADDWIAFSSQNRWNGVIFAGDPASRIFTQRPYPGTPEVPKSETNSEYGVQNKGVMILQRITTHTNALGQAVWFDGDLSRSENSGWIFAVAPEAYAAVRIIDGGWNMVNDSLKYHRGTNENLNLGQWAELNNEYSPIIIEVAPKADYASYTEFRLEMINNPLSWDGTRLDYTSTNYGTTLTLFADESAPPLIDGVVVNKSPASTYDSPYLRGEFDGGPVMIQFGDYRTIHGVAPFVDEAGCFALWHFDELVAGTGFADDATVSGRTARDAVIHPDSTDSVSVISDGKFGNAVRCSFETEDQYLMTTAGLQWPAGVGTFRYNGWFRLNQGDTGGTLFHLYDQVTLSVTESEATLVINLSGDLQDTSAANRIVLSAAIAADNDWQYLKAIYDGDSIQLLTESETVSAPGIGEFVPANRSVYIGSRKNKSNYVGDLDEVKVGYFVTDPVIVASTAQRFEDQPPETPLITNTISNFTPSSGTHAKLVVAASWEQGTAGLAGVTYAGLPFAEAVTSSAGRQSSIWYLDLDELSPASGAIVATFNAATDSRIGVLSLLNAAPGAPTQTVPDSAVTSVSISPSVDNSLVVGVYTENGNVAVSSDFENILYSGDSGSSVGNAGYQVEATPGLKTYNWTALNSGSAVAAAVFAPVALAAPVPVDDDGDGIDDSLEVEIFGSLAATDGSGDADGDGISDSDEFTARTNPRDAQSGLRASMTTPGSVSWSSVQGIHYKIWSKQSLDDLSWLEEASGIAGEPPINSHPVSLSGPKGFWMIEVEE